MRKPARHIRERESSNQPERDLVTANRRPYRFIRVAQGIATQVRPQRKEPVEVMEDRLNGSKVQRRKASLEFLKLLVHVVDLCLRNVAVKEGVGRFTLREHRRL